jgi:hypothetical protein
VPDADAAWPILGAHETRILSTVDRCGIPLTAKALSVAITAVNASAKGNLVVYRGDEAAPTASLLNYTPTTARSNNAIVQMAPDGSLGVLNRQAGTVDFVLDVNGYFE